MPRPGYYGLILVIANKTDLDDSDWSVNIQEGQAFCASIGAAFLPVSAKTGEGCGGDVLIQITNLVLLRRVRFMIERSEEYAACADGSPHDGRFCY